VFIRKKRWFEWEKSRIEEFIKLLQGSTVKRDMEDMWLWMRVYNKPRLKNGVNSV